MDPIKTEVEFKCPHCGKVASTKGNLKIHISSIHEGIKFGCNECDYKASQKTMLMNHIRAVHEGQLRACPECNKMYKWHADLRRHLLKHLNTVFKCEQCDLRYAEKRSLNAHIRSDHLGVTIQCDQEDCKFQGRNHAAVKLHKDIVHLGKWHECESCAFKTRRKGDLKRHVRETHVKPRGFQCYICDETMERRYQMRNHAKLHHKFCPKCNYRSMSASDFNTHLKSKRGKKLCRLNSKENKLAN